ncbi:MAG TPA: phage tail assembly protein [Caulobacteraceae bacterium]|nr:phage tail assembly protein [Caulobacteraceae bacterium]
MSSTTAPDELTVWFPTPVEFAGATWTQLRLREPTVREVKRLRGKGATEGTIGLIFDVSGAPIPVIEQLPLSVLRKARNYLQAMCRDVTAPDPLPQELVITLRKPVVHEEDTLFVLDLREPLIGAYKRTDGKQGLDIAVALIAAVTGAPESAVEEIGIRDFKAAEAYLLPFL